MSTVLDLTGREKPHRNGDRNRDELIATLRSNEVTLRSAGILQLSLSALLPEVRLQHKMRYRAAAGKVGVKLSSLLGCNVDVVEEPVRKLRFQEEINRDRAIAF